MATMVNMTNLLNGKDSRWLQLEVCREFQRNKCTRVDTECKFAHPPANVEVQNGRVTACYDSIKGRCNREKPPCKYFHPPQHLKDQLLINGRNHLALKNALMQQMGITPGQAVLQGQCPVATNPYLTSMPANATYNPFYAPGHLVPTILGPDPNSVQTVVQQAVPVAQQKIPRSDRIEVCREFMRGACKRAESECRFAHPQESVTQHEDGTVTVCMDAVKGRCARDPCRYFHPPLHLQAQIKAAQSRATAMDMKSAIYYENFAFHGMVPFKRPAADKSGIPVYQPGTTYQQLMQLQQPFVPVSCEYPTSSSSTSSFSSSTSVNNSTTSATHTATTLIPQPHTTITSATTANPNAINNNNNNVSTTTTTNNNHIFVNQSNVNNNDSVATTTAASNGIVAETNNNNNNTTVNKEQSTTSTTASNSVPSLNSIAAQIHNNHYTTNSSGDDELDHTKKSKDSASVTATPTTSNVSLGNSVSSHSTGLPMQHPSLAYSFPQAQSQFMNPLYANPAAIAKEVAQKNYQNALKLAAVSNALTGKPLSALSYSQVPFNKPALLPQPAYAAAPQLTSPRPALAAPVSANRLPMSTSQASVASQLLRGQTQLSALTRAPQPQATYLTSANPFAQFMRPQAANPATYNPAAAAALSMSQAGYPYSTLQALQAVQQSQAAAAANQQFMFNCIPGFQQMQAQAYPGMTNTMATSAQQQGVPQGTMPQNAAPGTTAVVLNPYKKMKTS
ncbi:bromodomain-containing protein DDB_G0280777 isoform X4 [Culicoides brevitarsis]|uniref:bromodomain-containing protein DDB_G0280777 isoform X4 n=1 Tax=Culicoides brevitarsis TaxID=469753 RepID=UPI00307C1EF4